MSALLHRLTSSDWEIHKYAIERRVKGLGKQAVKRENKKRYDNLMSQVQKGTL
jgi:hypothetical protein